MDVNGRSVNPSGLRLSGDQTTTLRQVKRILPNATNDVDIGSTSKRLKTLYYTTLDPVPGAVVGGYLALNGSTTMTGDLDMGTQEVKNVDAIRPISSNVLIGNGAAATGLNNIVVGENATCTDATGKSTVLGVFAESTGTENISVGYQASAAGAFDIVIGASSISVSALGGNNVILGYSGVVAGGTGNVVIGPSARSNDATSAGSIAIGQGAIVTTGPSIVIGKNVESTAAGANIFGTTAVINNTAGSLLVAASSNIRADTTTCDLGTVAVPFRAMYLNNAIVGPTSLTFSSTSGIIGTTTNNNAAALSVGELVDSITNTVSLTSTVAANVGSISLTAGDWDVWGVAEFKGAGTITVIQAGASSASATLPTSNGSYVRLALPFTAGANQDIPLPMVRFSLAATTTVYLVSRATFTSTMDAYGYIAARRRR